MLRVSFHIQYDRQNYQSYTSVSTLNVQSWLYEKLMYPFRALAWVESTGARKKPLCQEVSECFAFILGILFKIYFRFYQGSWMCVLGCPQVPRHRNSPDLSSRKPELHFTSLKNHSEYVPCAYLTNS